MLPGSLKQTQSNRCTRSQLKASNTTPKSTFSPTPLEPLVKQRRKMRRSLRCRQIRQRTFGDPKDPERVTQHIQREKPRSTIPAVPRTHSAVKQSMEKDQVNEDPAVEPPVFKDEELVNEITKNEQLCLIAKIWGQPISLRVIKRKILLEWEPVTGKVTFVDLGSRFYLIRFVDNRAQSYVWDNRPWFVSGRNLVLRRWEGDFISSRAVMDHAALWVRIPLLPLEYWSENNLKKLLGSVGDFIRMDDRTAKRTRGKFARVCLDVDPTKLVKESVEFIRDQKEWSYQIIYEGMEKGCVGCGESGSRVKKDSKLYMETHENIRGENNGRKRNIEQISSCNSKLDNEPLIGINSKSRRGQSSTKSHSIGNSCGSGREKAEFGGPRCNQKRFPAPVGNEERGASFHQQGGMTPQQQRRHNNACSAQAFPRVTELLVEDNLNEPTAIPKKTLELLVSLEQRDGQLSNNGRANNLNQPLHFELLDSNLIPARGVCPANLIHLIGNSAQPVVNDPESANDLEHGNTAGMGQPAISAGMGQPAINDSEAANGLEHGNTAGGMGQPAINDSDVANGLEQLAAAIASAYEQQEIMEPLGNDGSARERARAESEDNIEQPSVGAFVEPNDDPSQFPSWVGNFSNFSDSRLDRCPTDANFRPLVSNNNVAQQAQPTLSVDSEPGNFLMIPDDSSINMRTSPISSKNCLMGEQLQPAGETTERHLVA